MWSFEACARSKKPLSLVLRRRRWCLIASRTLVALESRAMAENPRSATAPRPQTDESAFLTGTIGELLRAVDWSSNSLGNIAAWPSGLKTLLATMLRARHPMLLWWGPELIQFYNEAFVPSLGVGKHPTALGQRGRESWAEVWPVVGDQIERVVAQGESFWSEDALVPIFRNGRVEEVHWTYGYSPVIGDRGEIAGVLIVCNETTSRVIAERRLDIIRHLVEKTAQRFDVPGVMAAAQRVLETATYDVPFLASSQLVDDKLRHLQHSTSLDASHLNELGELARQADESVQVHPFSLKLPFPGGAWTEPASQAVVLPSKSRRGLSLVLGISPRLPFDRAYCEFLDHVVEQIDVAIGRARAVENQGGIEKERRNLMLQAPMPTALLTGPQHLFELANAPYEQMVGRQVMGKTYLEAFPELEGTALPGILDAVYTTGTPFVAPELLVPLDRNGDGAVEDGYFKFNLQALRDGDGQVYGIVAVAFDITEQVRARKALEKTVLEAREVSRQLEATSIAKDEFLAIISHELRTPLNAILGWAHVIRTDPSSEYLEKGLPIIERNARAQAQLVEDLLDVSRIISGKVRMTLKPVDLNSVANSAVEAAQPSAAARGVSLSMSVGPNLGTIVADEDRLQQVIWNLLSNGVKFTQSGGHVTLRLERLDTSVRITVRDNGVGIPGALLPRVFDRFKQGDSSTTRAHGGLGLGLAIVRHLVELHGGTVRAQSEGEGKGAVFEVDLPFRARSTETEASGVTERSSLNPPHSPPGQRLTGVLVMVVDDDDDARELVATVLTGSGAEVYQANSAADAMGLLATRPVTILISDIGMPSEDGYGLIDRIRSSQAVPAIRNLPAIAVTAYARSEDRNKALAHGFQEHLVKPVEPHDLVAAVARLIGL